MLHITWQEFNRTEDNYIDLVSHKSDTKRPIVKYKKECVFKQEYDVITNERESDFILNLTIPLFS